MRVDEILREATKSTKEEVGYVDQSTKRAEKCRDCTMYVKSSSTCTAVEGKINPEGWCRLFERK